MVEYIILGGFLVIVIIIYVSLLVSDLGTIDDDGGNDPHSG